MQRLRLSFGRGEAARFISHLDTMRCWERVFRRAGVPIEYTHGFSPHPRMSSVAPLAVGVTSSGELLDIWIRKWMPPDAVLMLARREMPAGFVVHDAVEIPVSAPSLQSIVRSATYRCVATHPEGVDGARAAVFTFLQCDSVPYVVMRKDGEKTVELRPLVKDIVVEPRFSDACDVRMHVGLSQEGTVRPEHVLDVLGFEAPAISIHREAVSLVA